MYDIITYERGAKMKENFNTFNKKEACEIISRIVKNPTDIKLVNSLDTNGNVIEVSLNINADMNINDLKLTSLVDNIYHIHALLTGEDEEYVIPKKCFSINISFLQTNKIADLKNSIYYSPEEKRLFRYDVNIKSYNRNYDIISEELDDYSFLRIEYSDIAYPSISSITFKQKIDLLKEISPKWEFCYEDGYIESLKNNEKIVLLNTATCLNSKYHANLPLDKIKIDSIDFSDIAKELSKLTSDNFIENIFKDVLENAQNQNIDIALEYSESKGATIGYYFEGFNFCDIQNNDKYHNSTNFNIKAQFLDKNKLIKDSKDTFTIHEFRSNKNETNKEKTKEFFSQFTNSELLRSETNENSFYIIINKGPVEHVVEVNTCIYAVNEKCDIIFIIKTNECICTKEEIKQKINLLLSKLK